MKRFKWILPIILILLQSQAFSTGGESAKNYLDQGIQLYQQERYFEAVDSFRNALGQNPYYGDAYKYMAQVFFSIGDYPVSLENATTALKYANNDVETMLIIANSYREIGNYNQAEKYYKQIVDESPSYAEVYRNLSELYLKMNRLPLALSMINKADRINRNFWRNYLTYGNYYLKNGNYNKAEEYYKKAFNLNPTERLVYTQLADFYQSTGNYASAVSLLENGEKLFNNFYSGIVILADSYLKLGMTVPQYLPKAIEKFQWINQAGVNKSPQFKSEIYYKMALAGEKINRDQSVLDYKQSMTADPTNEFVRFSMEDFILQNFKVDAPIRKDLSSIRLASANEAYHNGDMRAYFLNLKKSVTLNPFLVEGRQKIMSYYEQNMDYFSAYQELKSMEKVDPSSSVKDRIEAYDWKIQNKKLELIQPELFNYRGLFLVNSDYYNFSTVYSGQILYNIQYSGRFKFSALPYRNKQGIDYILEYLRQKDYNFFIIASMDDDRKVLSFKLYDKTGKQLEVYDVNYSDSQLNRSVLRFLDWTDRTFPAIWKIGEEKSPGVYRITGGLKTGLSETNELTGFAEDRNPYKLRITRLGDYDSEITLSTNNVKGTAHDLTGEFALKSSIFNQNGLAKLKSIMGY